MNRNVDKIKILEHEIGRYQKKVADQKKMIQSLRNDLLDANRGNQETQTAVDAVLTAVVLGHGSLAEDPDEPGKAIGWRMEVKDFTIKEMREKYEIHARRNDKANSYVLGVVERKEQAG